MLFGVSGLLLLLLLQLILKISQLFKTPRVASFFSGIV